MQPSFQQYLDVANADTSSSEWSIEDAQIRVDLCHVDAFLAGTVYALVRNSGLHFSFPSFNATLNILPGVSVANGRISTQFAKSYTRVKTIFVTFGTGEFNTESVRNETNAFYWPARTDTTNAAYGNYTAANDIVEFQLHVGSDTMPQYPPIRSLAEFAYHLEKALDLSA